MANKYLTLAQEAFESSSAYIDENWRNDWVYSLKAFRNEHAPGSRYLSEEYKARSRLFPPHTRTIIRKNEAAAAMSLFSNMDTVIVTPGNPDDLISVASSAALKEVLEYRLSKTIPSYQVCLGGFQDAQVTGTVCSYQHWEYEVRDGKKIRDQPCIELRPIENIRIDGNASWIDPVNSSPYFCDIIPMYVCDVQDMMESVDDKTGSPKWKTFDEATIMKAKPDMIDQTRQARLGKVELPEESDKGVKAFDIVWVMRWFMRHNGKDMTYYTLGTEELLTDPKPLEEVYFHGKRPYVIGYAILESHKVLKTGLPMLTKPLQQESTSLTNDRIDNVKFVLHKRWLVARGRQVDVNSLVRGNPGAVTLMTDPKTDVVESNWPDVTSSAYVEHDRLKSAFDELAGNFSPSTKVANNAVNDTLGGSKMASQSAGLMSDYLLRTVIETWWEPVLRQIILLEQKYETDDVVLEVCANKARLFPRFGISRITDMLLDNEVNVTVNVGIGTSNPMERMQKFMMTMKAAIDLVSTAPPGLNVMEALKELFSNAGYRDGARFFSEQQDPRLLKAQQIIKQMQQALEGKQMEIQAGMQETQMKLQSAEKIAAAQLQIDQGRIQGDLQLRQGELMVKAQEPKKLEAPPDPELQALEKAVMMTDIETKRQKLELDATKLAQDAANCERDCISKEAQVMAEHENDMMKVAMQGAVTIEVARINAESKRVSEEARAEASREKSEAEQSEAAEEGKEARTIMEQLLKTQNELLKVVGAPKKKTIKMMGPSGKEMTAVVES